VKRVAITGFGVVSAVGTGREAFWDALARGAGGIRPITRFDAGTFAARLAAEVRVQPSLSPEVTGVAGDDPKVGFAVVACAEALAHAGMDRLPPESLLHLGTSLETFDLSKLVADGAVDFAAVARRALGEHGPRLQIPLDMAARLVAQEYGPAGLVLTNCSACAAGAQAIGHGFRAVRDGEARTAVCGGFDSMINPLGVGGFQLLGALTTDNERGAFACRPFDANRRGTVLGEGAAVVVLEPLDTALADGRVVLAEICGFGSSLDAHSLTAPDPRGDGALRSMRAALDDAGIGPGQIRHINTHGTGTQLNDEIEATAIRTLFAANWEGIPVSATKSVTGHCIAAAGAIEVGACLLATHCGVLPPNPSLDRVAPGCELNHVTQPQTPFAGGYVLSNSFGFGGQNATLVLRRL
jgi:3-oxoacyl-[acyl-carrier-protein] synthase II